SPPDRRRDVDRRDRRGVRRAPRDGRALADPGARRAGQRDPPPARRAARAADRADRQRDPAGPEPARCERRAVFARAPGQAQARRMIDVLVKKLTEIAPYAGPNAIAGIRFRPAARELGVSAWGMNVIEIDAGCEAYPEHDHVRDGQEEVYV